MKGSPLPAGPHDPATFVVAVIATFNRPCELKRLLSSLQDLSGLGAVLVVDNAGSPAIAELTASFKRTHYLSPGANLGCGGGLHFGETKAMEKFGRELTHLWILDDDVVVPPAILEALIAAMNTAHADAAYPMVTSADGALGWFPGLLDRAKFRVIKTCKVPGQYLDRCGGAPVGFDWATGISLLISRRAFLELGPHRTDYWVRGEDLEFSLRITHKFRGVFVPCIAVQHLPPSIAPKDEMRKHAAMLQNICYTSLWLPHGRRIAPTIPGNFLRFLRIWGWQGLSHAWNAFRSGAIQGMPAGSRLPAGNSAGA